MENNAEEKWISIKEVIEHFGVSRYTIYNWIEEYGMPAAKIGKMYRFKLSLIEEWMNSRMTNKD